MNAGRAGVLERILARKREEIQELRGRRFPAPPPGRPFRLERGTGPLRLIAEIKRRSPSAGALSTKLSVAERARAYAESGASAVSVLADRTFFDGALEHLAEARAACPLPVLCKDFVLDEVQLDAARAFGADAVLLIVRCLEPPRLSELVAAARAREIEPFVEIVSEAEAELALAAGARLIGVNARDLDTLAMEAARAERVLAALPPAVTRVHLSGLSRSEQVQRLATSSVDAALIGEALMRLDDPRPLLAELATAAA